MPDGRTLRLCKGFLLVIRPKTRPSRGFCIGPCRVSHVLECRWNRQVSSGTPTIPNTLTYLTFCKALSTLLWRTNILMVDSVAALVNSHICSPPMRLFALWLLSVALEKTADGIRSTGGRVFVLYILSGRALIPIPIPRQKIHEFYMRMKQPDGSFIVNKDAG
jgi:hypothetical protein